MFSRLDIFWLGPRRSSLNENHASNPLVALVVRVEDESYPQAAMFQIKRPRPGSWAVEQFPWRHLSRAQV